MFNTFFDEKLLVVELNVTEIIRCYVVPTILKMANVKDVELRGIFKITIDQARSLKFAIGGGLFWGSGDESRRHGGLGAELPALENFAFFCKNNFILGLF